MKKIPPSEHFYDKTYIPILPKRGADILAAFVRLYIF